MLTRGSRLSAGQAATLGACFIVGCALVAAATVASADSTPRRLYRPTHVGVAPSELVMLQSSGTGSSLMFVQVKPDGTIASGEYSVPAGSRLVITDVEWSGQSPIPYSAPGSSTITPGTEGAVLRVFAENKAASSNRHVVFTSYASAGDSALVSVVGNNGFAPVGGASTMVTGFSISSGARLTADVASCLTPTQSFPATFGSVSYSGLIVMRGYVVPDA